MIADMKSKEWFDKVYSILVQFAGAREEDRDGFIYDHTNDFECREWRFCGKLGFGGKYRSGRNKVDCYPEDLTPERSAIIQQTNEELANLHKEKPNKMTKLKDEDVISVWKCEECGKEAEIHPDWYEQNGTPMCTDCDCDMAYSATYIRKPKTPQNK